VTAALQAMDGQLYKIDYKKVKNHITQFQATYKKWNQIREFLGFGWDYKTQLFTADDTVWSALLRAHPTLKTFRFKPIYFILEIELCFKARQATRSQARGIRASNSGRESITESDNKEESNIDPRLRNESQQRFDEEIPDLNDNDDLFSQSQSQTPGIPNHRKRAASRRKPTPRPLAPPKRTTAMDKFTAAIADMNKEQQLMRELIEREMESQAESNKPFPKQALLAIRRQFPLLVEILTYRKTKLLIEYLSENKEKIIGTRAELFMSLLPKEREEMLDEITRHIGIDLQWNNTREVYGVINNSWVETI
jgi:hypothetical protein